MISRRTRELREAKARLRADLLAAREIRPAGARAVAGDRLAAHAEALPGIAAATTVAAYAGVGSEPPTLPLLERLRAHGTTVLLPLLRPGRTLAWAAYDGRLADAAYGLLQPVTEVLPDALATVDAVLAPALAVDRQGHRLGRGAGYYDRALATLAPGVPVWAVVYDEEVVDDVPYEEHDVCVTGVLTPSAAYELDAELGA